MNKAHSLPAPKVIFFDVNETLLDLSPLKKSVTEALQGKENLAQLWFPKLLHTSLVVTMTDAYRNFDELALFCLQQIASTNAIALTEQQAKAALKIMRKLSPYPEVPEALQKLKAAGYRIVPLTNSSSAVLNDQMKNSGLDEIFEDWFSVENVALFKPHRHVYRWACRQVNLPPEECLMVAAHDWDIAGAREAGLRGIFIERPGKSWYPFPLAPEFSAKDLQGAADYLVGLKE